MLHVNMSKCGSGCRVWVCTKSKGNVIGLLARYPLYIQHYNGHTGCSYTLR